MSKNGRREISDIIVSQIMRGASMGERQQITKAEKRRRKRQALLKAIRERNAA